MVIDGVDLYYERQGAGEPLLLLHGGFCSLEMMRPQQEALAADFTVYAPELPGHGRTADVAGPMSYERNVVRIIALLDALGLDRVHVVGFSDGAINGLLIALHHPTRIRSLVAISGNLDPSGFVSDEAPATEAWVLGGDAFGDSTGEAYAALSPDGPEHAGVVLEKLRTLWETEPSIATSELARIAVPTLVMVGDRDVIRLDHSRLIAASIPGGQLCVVPGATHGLIEQRSGFVTFAVRDFLASL
jgi:pimeloyl-ACP methyl ester carboxylesterase